MIRKNLALICLAISILALLLTGWRSPVSAQGTTWKIAILVYKNAEMDFPGNLIPISSMQGSYFNNKDLSGNPVLIRNDTQIDFDWNGSKPAPEVNNENFSARWVGSINVLSTRDLYFNAEVDDGVKVYLDGNLIINEWRPQVSHYYVLKNVLAGNHEIKVEYFQGTGGSHVHFFVAESKHASFQLTNDEIQRTRDNLAKIPTKIFNWSNNVASLSYDLSLIDRPMTTVGNPVKKGWWWASPASTAPELNNLSNYDSVFVLWPSRDSDFCRYIESCGGGWGLKPSDWTKGMTYAVQQGIMGTQADSENLLIHEWLHGVTGFFSDHGFNPQPDIDGAENKYGYKKDNDPMWSLFYADVVKKRVLDPQTGNYIGIGTDAWLSIKPSGVRKPDIDGNGTVGEGDLIWLNGCYDPLGSPSDDHCRKADLNNNNVVNALDYSLLLKNWSL